MSESRTEPLALGEMLLARGLITPDQLHIALHEQKRAKLPLGQLLVTLGFVSDNVLRDSLAENLGRTGVDLSRTIVDLPALQLIPKDFAIRASILPLALHATCLSVAMADPDDLLLLDQLRRLLPLQYEIEILFASAADIVPAIERYYGFELSIDGILREIETGQIDDSNLGAAAYSSPVVRLIDALLADAVRRGASDVHFEPEQAFVRIRYRIDGVLRQCRALHKAYWPAMAVRLKVMATMNIAETRAPQDGRMTLTLAARSLDFRVSAQPTLWGENIVLRVLDGRQGLLKLDQLGANAENLQRLKQMMARPEGLILLTGPTGSGKTTTLYSLLSHINSAAINIMTLEDPVEYPLPMIRQTSIHDALKMDFASGIRSLMRQDPDVILVGEIRDFETAEMALRAAMTGHQVYATLHSNSALGALPRLLDLGVAKQIVAGNLIGIVAQRLLRVLCPDCKQAYSPDAAEQQWLGEQTPILYRASGCSQCEQQGYRGRCAVMEVLKFDEEFDELLAQGASSREMRNYAYQSGFRTLLDDARLRVMAGQTSMDEVARVLGVGVELG